MRALLASTCVCLLRPFRLDRGSASLSQLHVLRSSPLCLSESSWVNSCCLCQHSPSRLQQGKQICSCQQPLAHAFAQDLLMPAGGHLAIATWCQRETTPSTPFTDKDRADLQFLYDEWAHPFFVSKEEYGRLAQVSCSVCVQRKLQQGLVSAVWQLSAASAQALPFAQSLLPRVHGASAQAKQGPGDAPCEHLRR